MSDELFATRLRRMRRMRGLSKTEVSRRCGISVSQQCRLEGGRADDPRLSTIRKLAAALECSASALVGE